MIPVCEPLLGDRELEYVTECVKSGWISSQGRYIAEFESAFAGYLGVRHGISTTSGTTALHLALASLGIGPGDEVIVPAFTMIASAFAVVYTGATPVLVDADPETWNMDPAGIEEKVTGRTKALMPVHIYGHPCDMDPIMEVAGRHGLYVVEDAAEAHGAEYKGRKAGGIGHANCFSFYANKIITTGEGGMVVTDDDAAAERARSLRNLSFPAERRYLHDTLGFNYRMTNIQAAIGLAQLERIDELAEMRRRNARAYNERLADVPGIVLPPEKAYARNVHWMYSILVEDAFGLGRDDVTRRMKEAGVDTRPFFMPMHQQPVFRDMGLYQGECYPVAEELSRKGMHLPSASGLTEEQLETVCGALAGLRG